MATQPARLPAMERRPHSYRLRIGRHGEAGGCYLLTACCHSREPHFADPRAARIVMETLRWLDDNGRMVLLAVVVMPDHVHFVATLRDRAIRGLMHSLKGCSAQRINRENGRKGRIWQAGYHDRALRSDQAVGAAIGYCLQNPVRAGFVEDSREYPHYWSKWRM